MESRQKFGPMIVGLTLGLCAFAGSAMAFNLGELLKQLPQPQGQQPAALVMAEQPEAGQSRPTQLIVPKDKRVATAMDEAMPTIKKVLSIHQCIKDWQAERQMNIYAVPGMDMTQSMIPDWSFPNSSHFMKFHDRNKCVSLTSIDNWSMPALNALLFRAVYFADDSGETVNFLYLFKKVDDGSWKIAQFEKGN